ncbi:hypothetical protein [Natrinema longum]|uniref:Uncharacterized protein n=1 Tax=Natrinema longum TaxID=370324 RepID=A0A8A2U7N1_9EURY|nr:hypothetical protein [Natrinema longum]MBZ6494063.1 hypothetical protein [Natrinema longum]QSW84603.1 hypothetical protein J0X27_14275 [Natrinema longum]
MSTERTRTTSGLDRRSYLKLAGIAVPAAISPMSVAGASDDGAYEVIDARGQTIWIDDGETFANKLIDYTTGEGCTIDARDSTNWTIRNIGFRGRKRASRTVFGLSDTGNGTSTVENVYLGDGSDAVGDSPHGPGGIFVGPEHNGTIEFRNVNVQEFPNNGIYASAPATDGDGSIHIDGCYAANCGISHYRVGGDDDIITNSSVELTERGYDGRGVWAWAPGPVSVADCEFAMNGRHYSFVVGANDDASHLRISDTEWDDEFHGGWDIRSGGAITFSEYSGNNPHAAVPDGCPASIADAFPTAVGDIFMDDQESTGESVTVGVAFYNAADTVITIETESGDVVGHSDVVPAGDTVEDLSVSLESPLEESQAVTGRLQYARGEDQFGATVDVDGESVTDTADVTITNEDSDTADIRQYDTNDSGRIEFTEALRAVAEYNTNRIDFQGVLAVIDAYNTGKTV